MSPASASTAAELQAEATRLQSITTELFETLTATAGFDTFEILSESRTTTSREKDEATNALAIAVSAEAIARPNRASEPAVHNELLSALDLADSIYWAKLAAYTSAQAAFNAFVSDSANLALLTLYGEYLNALRLSAAAENAANLLLASENSFNSAALARAAFEAAVQQSRQIVTRALSDGNQITLTQLKAAGLINSDIQNFSGMSKALEARNSSDKSDLIKVAAVVKKFETVDQLSRGVVVSSKTLVEVGLIPAESKSKSAIMWTLKRLSPEEIDTFEEIQNVVVALEKKATDRQTKKNEVKKGLASRRAG